MIELCEQERVELERRASTVTLPFGVVQHARMILFAAERMQDIDIAARLDCSPDSVARRRSRFCAERLDGLEDHARSGRPRRFPPQQVAEVKAIACELPRSHQLPLSRFSRLELHRLVIERGVCEASASTIWRWLHEDASSPAARTGAVRAARSASSTLTDPMSKFRRAVKQRLAYAPRFLRHYRNRRQIGCTPGVAFRSARERMRQPHP